jgi:hypothetical protein
MPVAAARGGDTGEDTMAGSPQQPQGGVLGGHDPAADAILSQCCLITGTLLSAVQQLLRRQ